MTENDKRLTKTLTEGAMPPGQSEGKCAGGTLGHFLLCPHQHDYGNKPNPYGVRTKHCQQNLLVERHKRWTTALEREMDRDCPNVDDIDWLSAKLAQVERELHASAEAHRLCREEAERRQLHERNSANARANLGPWEFTLTYSPKEHGWMAEQAEEAMREACDRLTRYYASEIEEFHAVGERTQAGQPHVHAWYKLKGGRKITTKSFKRAYPIWNEKRKLGRGHEGGHHAPIKRTSDFAGYIEKDLDTSWLILNITNEPAEADVQEAHDSSQDDSSQDGTPDAPHPDAEPDDRELRECS